MTAWLLVVMAAIGQSATVASDKEQADGVREVSAIRREVSELLKSESAARDDAERGRQVLRMTEVYLEVVGDERFVTNPLLQAQKSKLHTRLIRIRDELKRDEVKRKRRMEERGDSEQEQAQREIAGSLAAHLQLASQTLGGPAAVFDSATGGGPIDHADDLIDLITETINPSHWNVNGGSGSIMFYRPALALVVRASSEVQGRVGDLLGGLRE